MTIRVRVDPDNIDGGVIDGAADLLRGGGLVAFPTETVYGLGCLAEDSVAVDRVFAVKERP
ncbi:MAG: Sua5/YciO/YrdC/YwlC family protein, partial [Acidimicrobiia bacterium]|nr:Sua5/YciO/YrdC/YwlC family protein [Acidimicrobiia bacterium]